MSERIPTPGHTIGPFFGQGLPYDGDHLLVPPGRPDAIQLHGTVTDANGDPLSDAMVEIWQADAAGRIPRAEGSIARDGFTFTGFGRAHTDNNGRFSFSTVAPGRVNGAAAFWAVSLCARGLLDTLFTRIYLPGQDELAADRLLSSLPEDRRETLIATADETGFRHDIRLQGDRETVFLAYN